MDKKRILVIDDEESLCRSVKLNLEGSGKFEVCTETKGENAVVVAKAFKPDLVVLDFIMPDVDGGDVVQNMEMDPATKDIPIIFLTAVATGEDTSDNGAMIGGRYVLAKPFTTLKLINAIERNIRA